MDASFKPRPIKLVGPEGHATCQAVCIEHSVDKCDECGVDYSDLNLLARMLVQAPNLIVPPPPQVTDKSRSTHVAKFKDEGNVRPFLLCILVLSSPDLTPFISGRLQGR